MDELAAAWEEMCDRLRSFGQTAISCEDPLDRAEGIRHALRFVAHLADQYVEFADPLHPQFRSIVSPTRKFYGDGVDVDYLSAPIDGRRSYRISGTRGTAPHLSAIVYRTANKGRLGPNLTGDQIGVRPDGTFSFWIGPEPMEGPGAVIDEHCCEIVLREYHKDRSREEAATVSIELLGDDPGPRAEVDGADLAEKVSQIAKGLAVAPKRLMKGADDPQRPVNGVAAFGEGGVASFYGTSSNQYRHGFYTLGPGEGLQVRIPRIDADYISICLYNRWLESYEFRDRVVVLNDEQLVWDADGTALVTIGGTPKERNWLDPCGHAEGQFIIRYLEAREQAPEQIETTLVRA